MRKPLDNWTIIKRGYLFGDKTFYNNFHLGVDYIVPLETQVYAPYKGRMILSKTFYEGGHTGWFEFRDEEGIKVIRLLHLKEKPVKKFYQEGEVIALTGNSGNLTNFPHLHLDISRDEVKLGRKDNFIDPDQYFRNMVTIKVNLINSFDTDKLQELVDKYSIGEIKLEFINYSKPVRKDPPNNVLRDDEAIKLIDDLGIEGKITIIVYESASSWRATGFYPAKRMAFIKLPTLATPFDACFELSHALQKYYNEIRGSNPPIQIVDRWPVDERLMFEKYSSIIPHLDFIAESNEEDYMSYFEAVQVEGNKDVYLVRDGKKTRFYNADAFQLVYDWSKIKKVTKSELDAIPNSGLELAALVEE